MEIADSIIAQINEIKFDRSSGATELALKSVEIFDNQLQLIENPNTDIRELIFELSKKLINARPSMAPLINSIGYIINSTDTFTKNSLTSIIQTYFKSQSIKKKLIRQNFEKIFINTSFSEPRVMLISYSSTILDLILKFKDTSFIFYVLESRPLLEGRNVAQKLSKKYETHLIVDAAMGKFIHDIDMVFIGIDSILRDGSIVNKIGTYPLSVLATSNEKPVYAIGDSFKYNLRSYYDLPVEIIEKPKKELFDVDDPNLCIENYYFDITPPEYINRIISDLGILSITEFLNIIENVLPINWFKNFINL
jgi:translation initiation factor 2B subunit (eIF-2B alpha/beta/delta family)